MRLYRDSINDISTRRVSLAALGALATLSLTEKVSTISTQPPAQPPSIAGAGNTKGLISSSSTSVAAARYIAWKIRPPMLPPPLMDTGIFLAPNTLDHDRTRALA
jgi:hypothetical protein